MKKKIAVVASFVVMGAWSNAQEHQAINLEYMDQSVRPQDDFYNYVNGDWMKTAKIPSDRARWGSFDELRENTDAVSLALLKESINQIYEIDSDEQKISDLYNSYIDLKSREKVGLSPLQPFFKKIDGIKDISELQAYLTEVTPIRENPFFSVGISAHMKKSNENTVYLGGPNLGLGRNYYQKEDEKTLATINDYVDYINVLYPKTGQLTRDFKGPKIFSFEKQMGSSLLKVEEIRNAQLRFNPYAVKDLQNLVKNLDLSKYLDDLGIKTDSVIIGELNYYKQLDQFITQDNLPQIKEFLKFSLINGSTGYLNKELDNLSFDFYGKKMTGQKEQRDIEKRALSLINGTVGELLGKLYVKENFPPEAKAKAEEMISYLFKSFDKHINELKWMSKPTKAKALEKLSKFSVKIGYPDKWKDYSALKIVPIVDGGSLYKNMVNVKKWSYQENINKLGKPVDKTEWGMSPQTVNAYYRQSFNEIVFPAAILQPPFYDYKADAAVNFGGIGAVIGHEVSHGFDDSGSQFDGDGNMVNWWTKNDKTKFDKATSALVAQYDVYEPIPGAKVNGKFTLGENIGDLGGATVAYDALLIYLKEKGNPGEIDGFTAQQRFFLSWATIWRTKTTDEALVNQVKTDPHSPGAIRAFAPLTNIDGFYEAFDVKKGDKLFKPKKDRIIIW